MSDNQSFVKQELDLNIAELTGWISDIKNLPSRPSSKGVIERFVRDCKILTDDCKTVEEPFAQDLDDFKDRKNSLEIQFNRILQEHR